MDDICSVLFRISVRFVGLLIAVPLAAAIGVLIRFALRQYYASPLYAGPAPVASLHEIAGSNVSTEEPRRSAAREASHH